MCKYLVGFRFRGNQIKLREFPKYECILSAILVQRADENSHLLNSLSIKKKIKKYSYNASTLGYRCRFFREIAITCSFSPSALLRFAILAEISKNRLSHTPNNNYTTTRLIIIHVHSIRCWDLVVIIL